MAGRIAMTPEELRDAAAFLDTSREEINEKVNSVQAKVEEAAAYHW